MPVAHCHLASEKNKENSFGRPQTAQRKASFTKTLNKITSSTFNRRRTTALLPTSQSTANIYSHSRLPTPSGVARNASFLSSLHIFSCDSAGHNVKRKNEALTLPDPGYKQTVEDLGASFVPPPSNHQPRDSTSSLPLKKRDSSVRIEQRGLMQPMPPPLPKSSTIGDVASHKPSSSQKAVAMSLTRLNVSEIKRIGERPQRSWTYSPTTLTSKSSQTAPNPFPERKDSLMPPPARATACRYNTSSKEGAARSIRSITDSREDTTLFKTETETNSILSSDEYDIMIRKSGGSFREDFSTSKSFSLPGVHTQKLHVPRKRHDTRERSSDIHGLTPEEADDSFLIHSKQSPAYWLGRFIALSDKLRAAALPPSPSRAVSSNINFAIKSQPLSRTAESDIAQSDHFHPMHDRNRRDSRVFAILRQLCTTAEATESLAEFDGLMARATGCKESGVAVEKRLIAGKSTDGSVREKKGFFNGLVKKKASGSGL
ncbi:uncharacterized protein KY384_005520 [Bacidia gigantensis]|uniref:uncharacterized protein n=1 Tax=Bacidia gigantensis TaxID=2732470 RepID=UPI001D049D08|nr:uncharacterized protein KY384_005520 [Bacidia gigantensis]KAG8530038.1 hypothetical protein KY384_005520 [Bacidia gigantensis]